MSTGAPWSLVATRHGVWSRESGLSAGVWSHILIIKF